VDLVRLQRTIEDSVRSYGGTATIGNIPLTKQAERVLKLCYLEARGLKADVVGTEHLLLALLRESDTIAAQILAHFNVTYDAARQELQNILSGRSSVRPLGFGSPSG
jgi:ATP-dependent Clp protease ATP-binding subunit ClpC